MKDRKIVLGVTGSIAAYKSAELVRRLVGEGAEVSVVMTESACKFISPLTLGVLSKGRVYTSLFEEAQLSCGGTAGTESGNMPAVPSAIDKPVVHIGLAERCELLLIAPATANIIAKLAHGLADDLLSTVALAVKSPVLIAPAMNDAMFENPVCRSNMKFLKSMGIRFVEPEKGELASGKIGKGRFAELGRIVEEARKMLAGKREKDFRGRTVMVSAGPTREAIDPVRFISNPSTGKMGYALAGAARERGANVMLVSGPCHIPPPREVKFVGVETAAEMRKEMLKSSRKVDVILMAAAVANYRPKKKFSEKIKKGQAGIRLELERNPDILAELGKSKGRRVIVGFSMETRSHIRRAREKLREKNLDLIISNDPLQEGAGFGAETNIVQIVDRKGNVEKLPKLPKEKIAHVILDRVAALLGNA